jgi:hypothetical protein
MLIVCLVRCILAINRVGRNRGLRFRLGLLDDWVDGDLFLLVGLLYEYSVCVWLRGVLHFFVL